MTDSVELDPLLLEILVCPQCHSTLTLRAAADELSCDNTTCGLVYPIRDGIPVLLVDEAISPVAETHAEQADGEPT